MSIKTTQFSYDEEWHKRKIKLGDAITWRDIMEAGIMAIEMTKGIEVKAPKVKEEVKPEEPEETQEEIKEEKQPEVKKYYLRLDPISPSTRREFDVQRQNLEGQTMWVNLIFIEIEIDEIFRIRDNGEVVSVEGYKKFKKLSVKDEVKNRVMVEPIK